jgi:hypothetical protein
MSVFSRQLAGIHQVRRNARRSLLTYDLGLAKNRDDQKQAGIDVKFLLEERQKRLAAALGSWQRFAFKFSTSLIFDDPTGLIQNPRIGN